MKNVAVFFGGRSVEHEISVITGTLTLNSLDKKLFNAVPVYVHTNGCWYTGESLKDVDSFKNLNLKRLTRTAFLMGDNILYKVKNKRVAPLCDIAVIINCLHGERGEDGSLSGVSKMCNIPLASPDLFSSSVGMSKIYTKYLLKGLGVKVLPYFVANDYNDCLTVKEKIKFPVIIKPENGGSSIGIGKAENLSELKFALSTALRYSERAVVEPFLEGATEINCACYLSENGAVVSECEQPVHMGDVLSFSDKYREGKRVFPANIKKSISDKIKRITLKIYTALQMNGVVRMDFLVKENNVYLNEINTVPGSLSCYLFGEKLSDFTEMLTEVINVSQTVWAKKSTLKCTFNSGILNGVGSKGLKQLKK